MIDGADEDWLDLARDRTSAGDHGGGSLGEAFLGRDITIIPVSIDIL
jgi:hypothetical protein